MSLFGNPNAGQQQSGSLFGNIGQSNSQNQQQSGSAFGAQPAQQNTGFGSGSLFGQNDPQGGGLFSNTLPNQGQSGGLFGNSQQNQQQNQQQTSQQGGMFGGFGQSQTSNQQQSGPLASSQMYQPLQPSHNTVESQLQTIIEKWEPTHPNCVFRHYFYNKVDPNDAPYYGPGQGDDPKKWDEALSKKPGPGYIPVLCVGFTQMGERIKVQQTNIATLNRILHDINNCLDKLLNKHDVTLSVRALDAKRRHIVLKQRCVALATKVQVLRNRGYALDGDEEDLKAKLQTLEKGVSDPGLSARAEEIWARMVGVRERARILKEEMARRTGGEADGLDEETVRRTNKILEDYGKQLGHLKRELALVQDDLKIWEKEQPASVNR